MAALHRLRDSLVRRGPLVSALVLLATGLTYFARSPLSLGVLPILLGFVPVMLLAFVSVRQSLTGRPLWIIGVVLALVMSWHGGAARQQILWLNLAEYLIINGLFAFEFGRSLGPNREPMCTYFARLIHTHMTDAVARYTRGVTLAWTIFFVALMSSSLTLFWIAPPTGWMIFSDILTPILIGIMFLGEFVVRCRVLRPEERMGLSSAIRGYRASMALRR